MMKCFSEDADSGNDGLIGGCSLMNVLCCVILGGERVHLVFFINLS